MCDGDAWRRRRRRRWFGGSLRPAHGARSTWCFYPAVISGRVRGTGRGYGTSHEDTVRGSSGPPVGYIRKAGWCAAAANQSAAHNPPLSQYTVSPCTGRGIGGMRPRVTRATNATHSEIPINRRRFRRLSKEKKERDTIFLFLLPFRYFDPEQRRARLTTATTNGRVLSMFVTMEETGHNRGRSSKVIANRSTSPDRETYFKTDLCSSL